MQQPEVVLSSWLLNSDMYTLKDLFNQMISNIETDKKELTLGSLKLEYTDHIPLLKVINDSIGYVMESIYEEFSDLFEFMETVSDSRIREMAIDLQIGLKNRNEEQIRRAVTYAKLALKEGDNQLKFTNKDTKRIKEIAFEKGYNTCLSSASKAVKETAMRELDLVD